MKRLFLLISIALIALGSYRLGEQSALTDPVTELDLTVVQQAWETIGDSYLHTDTVDSSALKYGMAKGLVTALGDRHSSYFDPEEAEAFLTSLNGELQGIGAELKLENTEVVIVAPLPDSPAEKAGIRPGDVVVKVDGEFLGPVDRLEDIIMMIRGPKDTEVVLTVVHEGEAIPVDIPIIRDNIVLESVRWREESFADETIAVLQLATFTENVTSEFESALTEIIAAGHKKLVLDMRFNGGGFLDAAVVLASHFVDEGTPVVHIRDQEELITESAVDQVIRFEGEIAVLINEASASASEILAGLLQDYDLGHIMGTKSFGKGSVQEVKRYDDQSMLKVTVAEWLTAARKSIEGVGIEPDELVELDYDRFREGEDTQIQAALDFLTK